VATEVAAAAVTTEIIDQFRYRYKIKSFTFCEGFFMDICLPVLIQ